MVKKKAVKRIYWKEEDLLKITKRFYELREEIKGASDFFLLKLAQQVLPKDKQRAIKTRQEVKPALDWIAKHPYIPEVKPPAVQGDLSLEESLKNLARALIPILSQELLDQIEARVTHAVIRASDMTTEDHIRQIMTERKSRRPKITIMGLLPEQVDIISADYTHVFDLNFVRQTTEAKKDLRDKLNGADVSVGLVRFLKHSDLWIARRYSKRFIEVWGGMSSIKEVLDDIALLE